ncbi:MAG: hypothetical protein RIC89_04045 [Pseudomonadales bacterium]
MNPEISAYFGDFVAEKIRERVKDPAIADKLIPKDHGFGSRRLPLETRYFEAYHRDNVELVDLRETPIERITASGVLLRDLWEEDLRTTMGLQVHGFPNLFTTMATLAPAAPADGHQ